MNEGTWDLVERQGWNNAALIELFADYLMVAGLEKEFEGFCARRAEKENRDEIH